MPKVNNTNTRTRCEVCSKSTIKTFRFEHLYFEHIAHLVLVFLLLNFSKEIPAGKYKPS